MDSADKLKEMIAAQAVEIVMKGDVCQHLDAAIDAAIQKETP